MKACALFSFALLLAVISELQVFKCAKYYVSDMAQSELFWRGVWARYSSDAPQIRQHSIAVRERCLHWAQSSQLTDKEIELLSRFALLYQIGQSPALSSTTFYALDGARLVAREGDLPLAALIAHQGGARFLAARLNIRIPYYQPAGTVADLVDYFDICTSDTGQHLSAKEGRRQIKQQHGANSDQYQALKEFWPYFQAAANRLQLPA